MEVVLKRPEAVEEDRKAERFRSDQDSTMIPSKTLVVDTSARPSSSHPKDSTSFSQEDRLESTKAEMVEVREENERLKMTLTRIIKDYQSLQMQFSDIVQQQQAKKPVKDQAPTADDVEETVSLCLGTSSSGQKNKEDKVKTITGDKVSEKSEEGLSLGLEYGKFEGSANGTQNEPVLNLSSDNSSSEELKEEDTIGEPWPPSKVLKSPRNGDHVEASLQAQFKKPRVSVRTRCDGPTMNDGCQWRKYGQKISKGNPCPRAYYRCTVSPACPVRKQVQRCAEDMSILITTYEGTHNHPLPVSATAMASTTAAAASMLMSGPSSSQPAATGFLASSSTATTNSTSNLSLLDINMRSKQFNYLQNPSISSTASSSSHPTITLDLTAPPSFCSQANQYNRFSSNFTTTTTIPRYSSTSLNFSSSENNSSSAPTSWSSTGHLNYGGAEAYNKSSLSLSLGRQCQDSFYQSYLGAPTTTNQLNPFTDTIAKAITLDPKFQSVLTAAITSYVEARRGNESGGETGRLNSLPPASSAAPLGINIGCGTSYLNRSTGLSLSTGQGSLLLQSPLGFPSNKSASASPEDHNIGNIK